MGPLTLAYILICKLAEKGIVYDDLFLSILCVIMLPSRALKHSQV